MKELISHYEEYIYAFAANEEVDLALQLLAQVYADEYLRKSDCAKVKSEFKKIKKYKHKDDKTLDAKSVSISDVLNELNSRIVWICDNSIKDEHYRDKNGKDCYRNHFWHSLQSRIDSWSRPNFPLNVIRKILDNEFKKNWKKDIYDRIEVLSEKGLIKLMDIAVFDFRKNKEGYEVWIIDNQRNRLRVFTPCANGERKEMSVKETRQVSIDHVIPLDMIIKQLEPKWSEVLKSVCSAKKESPQKPEAAAKILRNKYKNGKVLEEQLETLMNKVRDDTWCLVMEQGENSKKSNITPYVRYEKDDNGKYTFIVAEHVVNPNNNKKYTIYMEENLYSGIKMKEEEQGL